MMYVLCVAWHATVYWVKATEGKGLHLGITHHISESFRSSILIGSFYSSCIVILCHAMNNGMMLTHSRLLIIQCHTVEYKE
jgi:hypothetical protein